MPAKHSASPFSPARTIFVLAVAILVSLVIWVAFRAVGPSAADEPTLVLPTSASLSLSPPPSPASSSPSPSVSPPHSAKPRPIASRTSRVPSKSPQATTKPAASLAAALKVNAWRGGYVATVRVVNTGKATATWKITVRQSDGRLGATWNAQGSQQGSSFVFAGGSLAPGASATFGYQAAGGRPSGCSVAGGTCRLS